MIVVGLAGSYETPPAWQDQAACRGADPALFFPETGEPSSVAKAICDECPVRLDCLDHAFAHHEKYGIWGGLTARERWHIRRGPDRRYRYGVTG